MKEDDRTRATGTKNQDHRALLKSALEAVERMQGRLEAIEQARTEPIAVIGMSCRFPGGANSPEEYWRLLQERRDAVREVPPERWGREDYVRLDPDAGAKMPPQYGGFIEGVDQFDPIFFGIAPREAATMDPQQRLVLEVTWEALERAGYAPDRLGGSLTGVFLGITTGDYAQVIREADPTNLDVYFATGNAHNAAAGRVAYLLGLRGPTMAVDTACSSSLTALHLACQSLRLGESTLALAGGVNLILMPDPFVCFSKWGMMAPDGRCKTFDAAADGFVRAEGCGMLVLKRLSDAVASRDPILAVLRGSAVNQDGASGGLTVPNGLAQQAVIRQALAAARLSPRDIDYVEAHGTGTSLGDPIELEALDAVLAEGRPAGSPLVVGSVKTNIGHLESASGVAGLMKVILSLQHGEIPANLHFHTLNPRITIRRLQLIVPTAARAWESSGAPRRAGVSSFGFSGTNVHLIVEEAPRTEDLDRKPGRPVSVLTLSAKSDPVLRAAAGRHAAFLSSGQAGPWEDYCYTSNVGRSPFPHRLAIVGASPGEVSERLAAFSEGRDAPGGHHGVVGSPTRAKVAFLFTGQGAQFAGMGRRLFESEPVFRRALERCDGILRGVLDRPLLSVLHPEEGGGSPIDETSFTQPALFSFEYALAELWKSWGVVPDIVLGHSVGEYTAACIAGVFSLEDGLKLIAARGRLMQALPRGGAMAAVFAGEEAVSEALKDHRGKVAIAALNAPDNTVISGEESEVASVMEILGRRNVESQRLVVSHAFHSHLLDPMLDPFERIAGEMKFFPPAIPVVSNLTGIVASPVEITTPAYWRRHVRNAVRFADGVRTIFEGNIRIFVEIGPAATLLGLGRRCLPDDGIAWIPSMRRDRDDCRQISEALAQMYAAGGAVDWEGLHRIAPRRRVLLPTYPFQRARHWITKKDRKRERGVGGAIGSALHPFFEVHFAPAGEPDTHYFEGDINLERFPYLADHRVQERAVFPATAFSELALAARRIAFGNGPVALEAVEYESPLLLDEELQARIQVRVARTGEQCVEFVVSGRTFGEGGGSGTAWRTHARGRLRTIEAPAAVRLSDAEIEEIKARCPEEVTGEAFYRSLAERGNQWGPAFQGVERLWRGDRETLGLVSVPEGLRGEMEGYEFHPAVADACGHPLVATLSLDRSANPRGGAFVGGSIDESRIYERPHGNRFWVHAWLRDDPQERSNVLVGDLRLMDETGSVVAELRGAHLWYLEDTSRTSAADGWVYTLRFEEAVPPYPVAGVSVTGPGWVVLADRGGVGEALGRALEAAGNRVAVLFRDGGGHGAAEAGGPGNVVPPERLEDRLAPLLEGKDAEFHGLVHLWALDGRVDEVGDARDVEVALTAGAESALALFRAMGASSKASPPRLWLVTSGAQRVGREDPPSDPAQAALWGLARTFAAEQPGMWGGIVDLDPRAPVGEAAGNLAGVLSRPGGEDQLALRGGGRFAARLVRTRLSPVARRVEWRPDATYVITGGLGGLGLLIAGWLVGKGVRHLVLIGRTPLPPREEWGAIEGNVREARRVAAVRRLESGGAKVSVMTADVGDGESLGGCLRSLPPDGWPEVRGVIHAAGVMSHRSLQETSVADLRDILHAKALGGWILHRWATTQPLDCFVMFSSASAVLNSAFVGGYAAANAFLDGLSHRRAGFGLPSLSVNWGLWGGIGMAEEMTESDLAMVESRGMGSIPADLGMDLFGRLVQQEEPQFGVIPVDWQKWKKLFPAFVNAPLLARVIGSMQDGRPADRASMRAELAGATGEERNSLLLEVARRNVADVLGLDVGGLEEGVSISRLGLDSLMATELRSRIEADTGCSLPLVRLLEGPSILELAELLAGRLNTSAENASPAKTSSEGTGGDGGPETALGAEQLLAGIDGLSDVEVDRLLKEMLAQQETSS